MAVELRVRWDGSEPGLAEHRLSLLSFGPALTELHRALRTAATRIEKGKDPNHPGPQKKYSARALHLDVQIKAIEDGCVNVGMDVVVAPAPDVAEDTDDTLAASAVVTFLDSLRSRTHLASAYLKALGGGVTAHSYTARRADGTTLVDEFSMGVVEVDEPSLPPVLIEFRGEVVCVTFTEGREAVAIRDLDGDHGRVNATATAAQVDTAIRMRREHVPVIARVFQIEHGYRLLSLRDARLPRGEHTPEARKDYIMNKWSGLLHHLAQ